ncbi:MAG: hypothetical protein RL338_1079 [Chloroflexota bacterium]
MGARSPIVRSRPVARRYHRLPGTGGSGALRAGPVPLPERLPFARLGPVEHLVEVRPVDRPLGRLRTRTLRPSATGRWRPAARLLARLGAPHAFSWPVAAVAVVPTLLVVAPVHAWAYGGGLETWAALLLGAHALTVAALVPLRRGYLRAGARPSRPLATIGAFALAATLRVLLTGLGGLAAGVVAVEQLGPRLAWAPLAGVAALVPIASAVSGYRGHRDAVRARTAEAERIAAELAPAAGRSATGRPGPAAHGRPALAAATGGWAWHELLEAATLVRPIAIRPLLAALPVGAVLALGWAVELDRLALTLGFAVVWWGLALAGARAAFLPLLRRESATVRAIGLTAILAVVGALGPTFTLVGSPALGLGAWLGAVGMAGLGWCVAVRSAWLVREGLLALDLAAIVAMEEARRDRLGAAARLDALAAAWREAAVVRSAIDPDAETVLGLDRGAADLVAEVARIGVGDAIRAGGSRLVEVAVAPLDAATCRVEVVGDGSPPAPGVRPGDAARTLDRTTTGWRLEPVRSGGSRLVATVRWDPGVEPAR